MAPLTKDTLDIANPAGESSVVSQSGNQVKPASGHLRSDAVSLEVPVRVHGSKVKDVVLGTTPHTEPFEEQTITMIIFPQGAVVKMLTPVNVGQMLVLTNLKSRQDAICRVVKVRANANLAAYVEVEFTNRQPGYWGVAFESDGPALEAKIAIPSINANPSVPESPKPVQDISRASAPPPSAPAPKPIDATPAANPSKPAVVTPPRTSAPPAKPAPSFIFIGSQEEVQPAASATATVKPGSSRESALENFAPLIPKTPAANEISPAHPASLSISELQGDAEGHSSSAIIATDDSAAQDDDILAAAAPSSSLESSRSTFGSFAGGGTLNAARSSSSESFGASFDSGDAESGSPSAAPKQNWTLIAACAGVLILGLGGRYFYLHGRPANHAPANANPPVAAIAQSAPAAQPTVHSSNAEPVSAPSAPPNSAAPVNANAATTPPAAAIPTNTAKPPKPATNATPQPPAPAKPAAPKVTHDMVSQALNAHPTTARRADAGSGDAPTLEDDSAAAPATNALQGIPSSNSPASLPPPTVQPEGPVKIGGNVKEPRLVSSAMPVYPMGAIKAGVSGDVVIQTTIDKTGKVVGMHVVSGPSLLRQAALDALRRWKYEPSTLDGQPVAVELQVTIKFRR